MQYKTLCLKANEHFFLGICYQNGIEKPQNDDLARQHYQAAANLGHMSAWMNLYSMFLKPTLPISPGGHKTKYVSKKPSQKVKSEDKSSAATAELSNVPQAPSDTSLPKNLASETAVSLVGSEEKLTPTSSATEKLAKTRFLKSDSRVQRELLTIEKQSFIDTTAFSPQDIHQLSQKLKRLNYFKKTKAVFPELVKLIKNFVENSREAKIDINTILSVCKNVSEWHLPAAILEMNDLLLSFAKEQPFSYGNWTTLFFIYAKSAILQQSFEKHLLPIFLNMDEKAPPSTDFSQLFYDLAMFDSAQKNPTYHSLATKILSSINRSNVSNNSPLFHAYLYFTLKYPKDDWSIKTELRNSFQRHGENLHKCANFSRTQENIFLELKKLFPDIQQEVVITEAGRLVDFFLNKNKLVIQYNGFWQHYNYNTDGTIAEPAAKDILATETLKHAGYQVIIIEEKQWHHMSKNPQKALAKLLADFLPIVSNTPQTFYGRSKANKKANKPEPTPDKASLPSN